MGDFFLFPLLIFPPPSPDSDPSLKAQIPALGSKSQPLGPNPSLEAQIPTLRPKSQFKDPNLNLEAQILSLNPQDWDLGLKGGFWASRLGLDLKAGIWVLRLGFGP